MHGPTRQHIRHGRNQRFKVIAISFVSFCALLLSITKAPQLAKSISQQFTSRMRLEQVEWEEVGATNLSRLITRDLLWKTSALKIGDELFSLNLDELDARLRTIPWLESIQIQKKLPSTLVVRYTVHHARATATRKGKLWTISESGQWIAPLGSLSLDLPIVIGATHTESAALALAWLDALEQRLSAQFGQVHEVNALALKSKRLSLLVDLKYSSRAEKVTLVVLDEPREVDLNRLKSVVQYLIKNNILVSTIDLRPGKKVVVNVGKRP